MASRSKRRRRVLGASCILAALIIAGSSFAWFTSKDEVTNRLTADANYGVSIVESFTPPANWIPGQHVNKDVFATNTGNVAAFVEEDVAGKLNVTFENYVSSFGVTAQDVEYVKATDDEKTALEAGGYLIWTNTTEPIGEKNVKRAVDDNNAAVTDYWKPTQTGFYVFRRAITENINTTAPESEKYELEGYYYVQGEDAFYKIMIEGNEDTTNANGDYVIGNRKDYTIEKDANGNLVIQGDIQSKIKFVTLKTVNVDAVDFAYIEPETAGDRPRLQVKYAVGEGQLKNQAANAVNVANAQADVDAATALINLAKAQLTAIDTVVTAADNVKSKAEAYNTAYNNKNNTTAGSEGSAAVLTSKGQAVVAAVGAYTELSDQIAVSNLTVPEIEASTLSDSDKTVLKNYLQALNTAVGNYNGAVTDLNNKVSGLGDPYENNSTDAQQDYDDVKAYLLNVETTYTALQNAAATIDNQTLHSGLTSNAAAQYNFTIDTEKGQIETLKTKLSEYIAAAKDDETKDSELGAAKTAYIDAISAYNTAVTNAGTAYNTATTAYDTAKEKSFDIKTSTPEVFSTVVSGYILDPTISSVTDQSNDTNVNNSATAAALYDKSTPTEATYVVSVSGLTTNSAFLNNNAVWPLGAENAPAGTDTLREILAQKKIDLSDAQTTADTLNAGAGETFTIDIFLDSQVGKGDTNTWKYIPVEGETNKARFYLNSILNGGTTSAKLVDEVVLGSDVSGKFKNLVFDLDVSLVSAQVTYESDNTLSTTATTNTFTNVKATVDQDGKVTWTKS